MAMAARACPPHRCSRLLAATLFVNHIETSQKEKQIMTIKVTSLFLRSSRLGWSHFGGSRHSLRAPASRSESCSHFSASAPESVGIIPSPSPVLVASASPFSNQSCLSIRGYHSSSFLNAQRRRRRGGASSAAPVEGDEPHAARPVPVKDTAKFLAASGKELDRIEAAIEPMKACNDVFDVSRSKNEEGEKLSIRLKGGDGTYIIQVDERNFTMNLTSPMSGAYTYVLCGKSGDWLGMDDAHIMEGMLTRDLIRQCNGVPRF